MLAYENGIWAPFLIELNLAYDKDSARLPNRLK